jgi:hypothetical protein
MKPHLLMLLLLAIPPLICNILAYENAEKTDTPPAAKSESASKQIPAPATPPATTPAAQPVPSHGLPARTRAWFM